MTTLPQGSLPVLQEHVNAGLVDLAGWALLFGGVVVTALWLRSLYR